MNLLQKEDRIAKRLKLFSCFVTKWEVNRLYFLNESVNLVPSFTLLFIEMLPPRLVIWL